MRSRRRVLVWRVAAAIAAVVATPAVEVAADAPTDPQAEPSPAAVLAGDPAPDDPDPGLSDWFERNRRPIVAGVGGGAAAIWWAGHRRRGERRAGDG